MRRITVFAAIFLIIAFVVFFLPQNEETSDISRGITGKVIMEKDGCEVCRILQCNIFRDCPRERFSIYIREPAKTDAMDGFNLVNKTPLVRRIDSDEEGNFEIDVPTGRYSLFLQKGENEYCSYFEDGYACPVTVEEGVSLTVLEIH